jgi:hypothetical protein
VLEPILKVVGARKLRELSAADVRHALSRMAAEYSSAAVTMGWLVLRTFNVFYGSRTIRSARLALSTVLIKL